MDKSLNSDQIGTIEKHLDSKNLSHVDLRYEVIDHISEGIRESMEIWGISFEDAYRREVEKWHYDLRTGSTRLMGLKWAVPNLVVEKCIRLVREICLKSLIIAFILTAFGFYFSDVLTPMLLKYLNLTFGIFYFLGFLLVLFFYFEIWKTKIKSTYSFLFRINAVGFGLFYLFFNPVLVSILSFDIGGKLNYASLFGNTFFLTFSYFYLQLFKNHMLTAKDSRLI